MRAFTTRYCLALALALSAAGAARAELISGGGLITNFEFDGTFHYFAGSASSATITVSLTNTSPGTAGHLTGFAFNNPGNQITTVSLTSAPADFGLLGSPYANTILTVPYGLFDIGASTGGTIAGDSGQGLAPGQSGTFEFTVGGSGLNTLTAASFFQTSSAITLFPAEFVATYRRGRFIFDIAEGQSSPDPEPPSQVPEPGAALLAGLGAGLAGLSAWRRYRRIRRAEAVC